MATFFRSSLVLETLFLFVVMTPTMLGQVDSALGFFPLHTGDVHQYRYHYSYHASPCTTLQTHSSYHIEQILGDTLLLTGFKYKMVVSNVPEDPAVRYLRVDTLTANVYSYEPSPSPHDVLMDSLRATPGTIFHRDWGYPTQCLSVDTLSLFGTTTIIKRFRGNYIYGTEYTLAYGFGRVQQVTYQDDPCYPVLDYLYRDLVYARINGQEFGTFVGVRERQDQLPALFDLGQNYPNPFNPSTTFEVSVPQTRYVTLAVFDLLGQEVVTLVSKELQPGKHLVKWNASGIASGVYFYRLTAGDVVLTKRLVLLK